MGLNNWTHHGYRVLEEECRLTSQDAGQHSNAGACPPPANVGVARLPSPHPPHWLPSPVRPIQAPVRGAVVLGELLGNGCMQQQQQCCRMWIPAKLGRTTYIHAYSSSGMRVKTEGLLTGHNLLML